MLSYARVRILYTEDIGCILSSVHGKADKKSGHIGAPNYQVKNIKYHCNICEVAKSYPGKYLKQESQSLCGIKAISKLSELR